MIRRKTLDREIIKTKGDLKLVRLTGSNDFFAWAIIKDEDGKETMFGYGKNEAGAKRDFETPPNFLTKNSKQKT
jgi:hypothetical protein